MVMNVGDVLSAYKKTGGIADDIGAGNTVQTGGQSFSDSLKSFLGDAVGTLKEGEKAAASSAMGANNNLTAIAASLNDAEVMLNEIVAIRDKVIAAYQAITSSAI